MTIALGFNHYEYEHCPTNWRDAPKHRIYAIMCRLSRDKYIPPEQVKKIGWSIACKLSGAPRNSYNAAINWDCGLVGMIRGKPPLYRDEPGFRELMARLEKRSKKALPELIVLNVMIKTELDEQRRQRYAK